MRHWLSCFCFSLLAARVIAAPPEALARALIHQRTLPPDPHRRTRYLDCSHTAGQERANLVAVASWFLNAVSRESDIVRPVDLGGVLVFDLRDYQISPEVFGKLGYDAGEPFFHAVADVTQNGKTTRTAIPAPWLDAAQLAELYTLTGSQVPIVRADWFLYQTLIAADRQVGYYDLLGLGKKEADFFRLVGANAAEAKRLKLEMAASVTQSTVAIHNRGITRLQSLTGGLWLTADYAKSTDKQNTARLLKGDTEPPDGEFAEVFGVLPNGLFAYWLQNAKGDRADTAPDFIASDGTSTSPDRRVATALSCARCHLEGLRPIDDYARRLFSDPLQLRSFDYDRLKRLRQLYLSDLPAQLAEDNARYARALAKANGLSPAQNAKAVAAVWERYADAPVSATVAARELGIDERRLITLVRAHVVSSVVSDPVIAAFAQTPPLTLSRDHFSESWPQFQKLIAGGVP